MRQKLSCYNPSKQPAPFEFYIQNKGYNSGKPHFKPMRNSFVASFNSHEEHEQFYWLCYALFQASLFKPLLKGSVIPYITIEEAANLLEIQASLMKLKQTKFIVALEKVVEIEEKKTKIEGYLGELLLLRRLSLRNILS